MTVTLTRVFNNALFKCSLECSLLEFDLSFAQVCHSHMISTQLHFIVAQIIVSNQYQCQPGLFQTIKINAQESDPTSVRNEEFNFPKRHFCKPSVWLNIILRSSSRLVLVLSLSHSIHKCVIH